MSNKILRETERNPASTVYVGNLDEAADEEVLYEFGLQAGPVVNVYIPLDRVNGKNSGFGFLEYRTERDADYATQVLNGIMLYGKPLRINKSSQEKVKQVDIGAEVFVGNLDPMVDERTLNDTFSVFGKLLRLPTISRDEEGFSRGFGFVSFADFESSDKAIESMNDQYLMNKQVHLSYAFKKEGKGERHGDEAERLLAAEAKKHNYSMPSEQFISSRLAGGRSGDGGGREDEDEDNQDRLEDDIGSSGKSRNRGRKRPGKSRRRGEDEGGSGPFLHGANAIPTGPRFG